ncbi:MAG: hypothetical protein IPH44_06840 [Myxococcales bacterium]|nr:hypothetical protein [Myxococcales bacterium]
MEPPAYRVVLCEVTTGIVLARPGMYAWNVDAAAVARDFATLGEARAYAALIVAAHPDVECWIQHLDGAPVERVYDVDGYRRWREARDRRP